VANFFVKPEQLSHRISIGLDGSLLIAEIALEAFLESFFEKRRTTLLCRGLQRPPGRRPDTFYQFSIARPQPNRAISDRRCRPPRPLRRPLAHCFRTSSGSSMMSLVLFQTRPAIHYGANTMILYAYRGSARRSLHRSMKEILCNSKMWTPEKSTCLHQNCVPSCWLSCIRFAQSEKSAGVLKAAGGS
jgi:hypothetical protein